MYNPVLDTLIAVADCGSFTKAAERLYLSPTAVMKQMNQLERRLGLQLLNRAPSGITLTAAGELICRDAKFMIDYSKKSIASARASLAARDTTFRVGTSLLNPAKPFMDLWYQVNREFADYKLHLVPFDDEHSDILTVIAALGERFDFLIGVCDSRAWLHLCNFLELGKYRKMVAVPRAHALAQKKRLCVRDLYGETLMMVKGGDSDVNDRIRADLTKNHPAIHLADTPQYYDLSVFNRCAESGNVLLTIECWRDVHPGLVTIPVEWGYEIPYGLLYSLNAPEDVRLFVETVRAHGLPAAAGGTKAIVDAGKSGGEESE